LERHASCDDTIESVAFGADEIATAVDRIAAEIVRDADDEPVLLVGVLKGALFFTADLARAIARRTPAAAAVNLDFIAITSYGNSHRSSGEVRLLKDTSEQLEGRNVILVEDIVDNGLTLAYLQNLVGGRAPKSLRTAVLLDKPYHRRVPVVLDYVGLQCPDTFIVGYGLDYQERYRSLPYLATLRASLFE